MIKICHIGYTKASKSHAVIGGSVCLISIIIGNFFLVLLNLSYQNSSNNIILIIIEAKCISLLLFFFFPLFKLKFVLLIF
jgi:hypothetical protein